MRNIDRSVIEEALDRADIPTSSLREDYSGRFMDGETCFGIVGSQRDFASFCAALVGVMNKGGDRSLSEEIASSVRTDSMGRGTIFYFPGFTTLE